MRRQILWRVADLGYSEERFRDLDMRIAEQAPLDRGVDPSKVERYAKKYSWIAYFEMWGVRLDRGRLPEWRAESRPSDVDIDPSFPTEPRTWMPPVGNVFKGAPSDPRGWLTCGATPDYRALLKRREVDGMSGSWVLLNGYVHESMPADSRRIFTFLWGRLVEDGDTRKLVDAFRKRDYPGNFAIPQSAEDLYTFAGEIPWSTRFGSMQRTSTGRPKRHIAEAFERYESSQRQPGIPVEVTTCDFSWESYHSTLNQVRGVSIPAPAICSLLKLVNHAREWDLYERDGRRATLYVESRRVNDAFDIRLLYIREDLLRKYAEHTSQELVWSVWGERELDYDVLMSLQDELSGIFQRYQHIHRRAYVWHRHTGTVSKRA